MDGLVTGDGRTTTWTATPGLPAVRPANNNAPIERREQLGGLLNFYYRRAA